MRIHASGTCFEAAELPEMNGYQELDIFLKLVKPWGLGAIAKHS